jgi:hypothetical protein
MGNQGPWDQNVGDIPQALAEEAGAEVSVRWWLGREGGDGELARSRLENTGLNADADAIKSPQTERDGWL